jgi:hypothetical protein
METIAKETEQDLLGLAKCLQGLGVEVLRPHIQISADDDNLARHVQQSKPPMNPGDDLLMLGTTLITSFVPGGQDSAHFDNIVQHVSQQGNPVQVTTLDSLCGAGVYQLDNGIFYTVSDAERDLGNTVQDVILQQRPNSQVYRMHQYGHIDAWFTPVTPGLIIAWDDPDRPRLLDMFFDRYFEIFVMSELPEYIIKKYFLVETQIKLWHQLIN